MSEQRTYPLVDMAAVHRELGAELEAAVLAVVRSGQFVGGEPVAGFEAEYGAFLGGGEVVGVANGTDALELAIRALGLSPGAEILIPDNTFFATAEAVVAAGAVPRFVDVAPDTGLIDLEHAHEQVDHRTEAIIPVHLYGRMADMEAVMSFAARHGLAVVEDAAQAHGAERDGRRAGTVGHVGCFSFYPGKNLGAFGDAGALVTADPALAERVRLLRDHGRSGPRDHAVVGRNARLDPIHAAVLRVKLRHLERWNEQRRQAALWYREALPAELLDPPMEDPAADVHHLFPVLLEDREDAIERLTAAGVQSGIHYPRTLTQTTAFAGAPEDCPVAVQRAARQLSLPMHPHLSRDDTAYIASLVASAVPAELG